MVNFKKFDKFQLGEMLTPIKIYSLNFKEELENLYQKLNFDNMNYVIISNLFFLSLILSFIFYILIYPFITVFFARYTGANFAYKFLIIFSTWFLTSIIFYYVVLIAYFLRNDAKFKKHEFAIEKALPEFIDNLVSNLKGGISLEKALLKSVRNEQVELLKEVTLINQKVMMGFTIGKALNEFAKRFNSPIINRTFFLVEEGIKSGGDLAAPLEKISMNIKRVYELDEEIKSSAGGFTIVINAIAVIVAPLLFALALTLLDFISQLFVLLAKSGNPALAVSSIRPEFNDYLVIFSYSMIILITIFSSLINSQLKGEKTYASLKTMPFLVGFALFLFVFLSNLLIGFFGNILG